jgi:ABC-type antimicrobial peptide transport system permease subunit
MVFGISPHSLSTLGVAVLAVLAIAAIAALVPARRAMRLDPVHRLRRV